MIAQLKFWFTSLRAIIYTAAFLLLWRWLALGARRFDSILGVTLPGWIQPIAVAIMVAGLAIDVWGIAWFVWRGRGTPFPLDAPREFVASGPYKFVRNPMYVGGLIILAGFALFQRSVAMLLFTLLAGLIAHLFVLSEEYVLERKFGESYLRYKQSVNRWWPKFSN
jgi:protein-S-isoprenylcysteine O-methyltransferase Ste14